MLAFKHDSTVMFFGLVYAEVHSSSGSVFGPLVCAISSVQACYTGDTCACCKEVCCCVRIHWQHAMVQWHDCSPGTQI
ncbi:hypothetical protein COO60DRAFT_665215 [Scenedesmus sp. NREL 46B-D3]|nr:hypothetical protein COO60DRAFT_665215 [Scenedesmus sp. NREL 46B-D3]